MDFMLNNRASAYSCRVYHHGQEMLYWRDWLLHHSGLDPVSGDDNT